MQEIRESFRKFFEAQGHAAVKSSSLIPAGDPTLLFANAGMVQFKDCFLGTDKRDYKRATTCQKCLRISGKHNDLENVGRTARHHTFFEMLGNFSFGDYFKEDAINFAWKFLTEVLNLPKERLWVTIYEEDDEAGELWQKNTDVFPGRILRCGKKDNFWAMGETGPCGPCSEIHYYLGDNVVEQSETEFRKEDGSYMEVWNLVFMQFNRDAAGNMHPLPKPSVDTGMGLERIAAVKQGVKANYDTDELRLLIAKSEELSGKRYVGTNYAERDLDEDPQYAIDVAMRVIADHIRATAFLISDGINPGSDGRGYVLRRLIRRACRHGRNLGFHTPTLFKVAEEVIRIYSSAYPELLASAEKIKKLVRLEEEKFLQTLDSGMAILDRELGALKSAAKKVLSGKVAFTLHDTYGFPLDMTEDIARNKGLAVDTDEFAEEMELQKERSRAARASDSALVLQKVVRAMPTKFVGYDYIEYESTISGLFGENGEIESVREGAEVAVVTAETPFYAESGGQVGDTGTISSNDGVLEVLDTQKGAGDTFIHICRVTEGEIKRGNAARLAVSAARRRMLRANHSATHLLHLALRDVLGDHVKQAGSRVWDTGFRFDFSHFESITTEQAEAIEAQVNHGIQENHPIETTILPVEEAKKTGAMALFDEKYGDTVRVVQMGPRSRELCGGTHAERTGDLGVFTIIGESSIAAGVRRIEAVAGRAAWSQMAEKKRVLSKLCNLLRSGEDELEARLQKLTERNRELERALERLGQSAAQKTGDSLIESARELPGGVKLVASRLEGVNPKQLREMADKLKAQLGSACIALATVSEGKAVLLTAVTEDLTKKFHAGKLIEEMGKVLGCRGGGRPDMAQAGGGDPEKLTEALKRFEELVVQGA